MRKAALATILLMFALVFSVFAQSADDYVLNSKTVPDIHDQSKGWVLDPKRSDRGDDGFIVEFYENKEEGLVVILYLIESGGVRTEYAMEYGGQQVAKAAVKSNGEWYVARGPFYDKGEQIEKNYFIAEEKTDSTGRVVEFRVKLDTIDGMREVVFYMP